MNVLMIGVDETSIGGMLTVVNNYKNNKEFCEMTNLKYIATVIRSNKLVKRYRSESHFVMQNSRDYFYNKK